MKCPHCLDNFHSKPKEEYLNNDPEGTWYIFHEICPACRNLVASLVSHDSYGNKKFILVRPKNIARAPLPQEVDDSQVVEDYTQSSLVLTDSPKASAALSRCCLQYILREKAGVKKADLNTEIQEVLDSNTLPSDIASNLDAVRNIGNFAAHPIKSTSTGEIVDVEPHEAEWNLEVLEQLIDFYYVRPAIAKKKRDDLNAKLASAGKPPLK